MTKLALFWLIKLAVKREWITAWEMRSADDFWAEDVEMVDGNIQIIFRDDKPLTKGYPDYRMV